MGFSLKKLGGRALRAVNPTARIVHGLSKKGNVLKNVGGSWLKASGDAALGAGAIGAGYLAAPAIAGAAGSAGGALGGASAGGWGGAALGGLKRLGAGALKNPDLLLGGLSAYEGMRAGNRADKAAQAALDFERQRYTEGAPLRQLGMKGMLASPPTYGPLRVPTRESLGFDPGRSSNPFRR